MNKENRQVITQENLKAIIQRIKDGEEVGDELTGRVIEGDFVLNGVEVQYPISFENSHFMGLVDLSHATFKKVVSFKDVIFEGDASFISLMLERDIYLDRATFKGSADFSSLTAQGVFHCPSVVLEQNVTFTGSFFHKSVIFENCHFEGEVDFHGATEISGDAIFNKAEFHHRADFYGAIIRGMALFSFTRFRELANFTAITIKNDIEFIGAIFDGMASFDDIQLDGDALFWATTFSHEVDFCAAHISGNIEFPGAIFNISTGKTTFNGARIGRHLLFGTVNASDLTSILTRIDKTINLGEHEFALIQRSQNPAKFEGEVDFVAAKIGGVAIFMGAKFEQPVRFNDIHIDGHTFFRTDEVGNQTVFCSAVDFVAAHFGGNAEFDGATFKGKVDFAFAQIGGQADFMGVVFEREVAFSGIRIARQAFFQSDGKGPNTTFKGEVDFISAQIGSLASFKGAVFEKDANFYGARFDYDVWLDETQFKANLEFSNVACLGTLVLNDRTTFSGKVDLRNCIYNNIKPVDLWGKLLDRLDPYDRQPFTQLVRTLRRSGEDRLADQVYYLGQCRYSETVSLRTTRRLWLIDFFRHVLTGYGVRLWQLFGWIVVSLLLGTIFFFLVDGAVVTDVAPPQSPQKVDVTFLESIGFAVKHFLPIGIPFGEGWVPSSDSVLVGFPSTFFATILTICGWILVPLSVAAFTGVLNKRE